MHMTTPTQTTPANSQATRLSPAERTAKLLAFRGSRHNYGAKRNLQADADKTAKIIGRSFGIRAQ
jgi:hypothetical protein